MRCLDEATALAFARGELSTSGIDAAVVHIDRCDDCRMLVALAASGAPQASTAQPPSPLPHEIGRFEVEGVAGRGAMGIVYRGRDPRLDRPVALKVIRPELLDSGSHARLEREARALAKVDHRAVVGVYEVGDVDGSVFVAMEFVNGGTLEAWLATGRHAPDEIVARFVEAGEGLLAAHQAGLVHRDFKPSNAMLDERGHVHVTDFGLVSDGAPEVGLRPGPTMELALTQTGVVVGTPAYMAPEQLDAKVADPRSDQFSFCVALFEALAGHRPFEASTIHELAATMASGRPSPPRRPIRRRVHRALLRGLAPRPSDRFPSMRELLQELAAPRRANGWTWLVGLVTLAGLGSFAVRAFNGRQDAPAESEPAAGAAPADTEPPAKADLPTPAAGDSECTTIDAQWEAVWTKGRSEAVRKFEKKHWPDTPPSGVHPKLAENWQGVGRVNASMTVDEVRRFGDTWRSLYADTCADPAMSKTSSARLRRACLRDVLGRVEALLLAPPPRKLRDGLSASRAHLSRCSTHLVESLTLPEGDALATVERARELLSGAAAARWAGSHERALALTAEALTLAQQTGDPPLLAEVWLEQGRAQGQAGHGEAAIESLHESLGFAQPSEHHRVFREAAEALSWWYLFAADDDRQARLWLETAQRLDGKVAPSSPELGRREIVRGHLAQRRGDGDAAIEAFSAALAHELTPDVAVSVIDELVVTLRARGRHDDLEPMLVTAAKAFALEPSVIAAIALHRQASR